MIEKRGEKGTIEDGSNTRNEDNKKTPPMSRSRNLLMAFAIVLIQFIQMIPYGAGINGALEIAKSLGSDSYAAGWIAASYPLTQGAFVIMGGRTGMILGHKSTLMIAGVWWIVFTLASGFARNVVLLCVLRALTGIGGAFMVPNCLALLTVNFPPGKLRNITVSMFGAMAPVGAAGGGILPGFFVQLLYWEWLFFFLAILGTIVLLFFYVVVPSEGKPFDRNGQFDFLGAYLGTTGLILFNFVWNQAPAVGWKQPYEYALLIVSLLHLAAFALWELRFASAPIFPFDIWKAPSFAPMIAASFLAFMAVGIVIWYVNLWNRVLRGYTIFSSAATYAPLAIGGAIAAVVSGIAIRWVSAQYIMAIGSIASATSLTLIATQPVQQTYWAQTFPAVCIVALGPDFIFTSAQIIAANAVKRRHQGIAGSQVGTVASYGLSTGLGFASTVEASTNDRGTNIVQGYRNALYLGIGIAGLSTILSLVAVRIPKDTKDGWDQDDQPDNAA